MTNNKTLFLSRINHADMRFKRNVLAALPQTGQLVRARAVSAYRLPPTDSDSEQDHLDSDKFTDVASQGKCLLLVSTLEGRLLTEFPDADLELFTAHNISTEDMPIRAAGNDPPRTLSCMFIRLT